MGLWTSDFHTLPSRQKPIAFVLRGAIYLLCAAYTLFFAIAMLGLAAYVAQALRDLLRSGY